MHCVTRPAHWHCPGGLDDAGRSGDRIKHGSVVPPQLRAGGVLGLVVVTQPRFVHERGDRYLVEVDADDLRTCIPAAA